MHFKDNLLFGDRQRAGDYKWQTYAEALATCEFISAGLISLGFATGTFTGVCGPNRSEWHLSDISAIFAGHVTLPIHTYV